MRSFIFGGVYNTKWHDDVEGALHESEDVLARVQQSRLFKSLFNPDNFYVTNKRVIIRYSRLFGLISTTVDIPLSEILYVVLEHGIVFSKVQIELRFKKDLFTVGRVPKEGALLIQKVIRHPFPRQRKTITIEPDVVEERPKIELNIPISSN